MNSRCGTGSRASTRYVLGGFRGFEGVIGALLRTVELDHDVGLLAGVFERVEDAGNIDLPHAQGAVAGEVLPALVVFQVHVFGDGEKVLDDFGGIGSAFCNWPASGANFMTRVLHFSMT